MSPRPRSYFLLASITIALLLSSQSGSAADIGELRQICGGVAGISCPQGFFCAYPRPPNPDTKGICREKNSKALIEYGDVLGSNGDALAAIGYYNQAYNLSAETTDPYAMVALADRYLRLHYERAAMDSYASAVSYASQWINEDSGQGQRYAFGLRALQDAINSYNSTIQMLPASPITREWFKSKVSEASSFLAAQTSPPGPRQPPPRSETQPTIPAPVPIPSGFPPGIFCPPETVALGGNCVPILPFPGLPSAK